MAKLTIVFGGLLIILGVVGYVITGQQSVTALIPAFAGILFVILGGIALKESLRKHAMHVAAALALLGFFGTAAGLFKLIGWIGGNAPERPAAVVSQSLMSLLCIVFVALCVKSFIDARRKRRLEAPGFPRNPSS